jgi:hypothetical protein
MNRNQLRSNLLQWLEEGRKQYFNLAQSLGVPCSVPVTHVVATEVTDTSAVYQRASRMTSPLSPDADSHDHLTIEASLIGLLEAEPANDLFSYYGKSCDFWTGPPNEMADAKARRLLGRIRTQYLSVLDSLAEPDPVRASDLIDGLLSLIECEEIQFVATLALAGLAVGPEGLYLKGVTVRPLSPSELGALAERDFLSVRYREHLLASPAPSPWNERVALVVRTSHAKSMQPRSYRVHAVVLALQLSGFYLHGSGRAIIHTEPGPSLLRMSIPVNLLRTPSTSVRAITTEDLGHALDLADRIPEDVFFAPSSRSSIALHRLMTAACEASPADAIVDYVIALEAMLLKDSDELSFKHATFGASFLADERSDRKALFEQLREVYRIRSKVVHGLLGPKDHAHLESTRVIARTLASGVMIKALREGWPSAEDLRDRLFS